MKSLGTANCIRDFVPNFALSAAPHLECAKAGFDFNKITPELEQSLADLKTVRSFAKFITTYLRAR
jgi:hypothetical protein